MSSIDLQIDYPSRIARMLLDDAIDIGLVPVAVIPSMNEFYINSQYCIGCDGPVASVCLFSEIPINKVKYLLMDYQSRTSVELAKILLRDYWKLNLEFIDTKEDFRHLIREDTAGLMIGDRALQQRKVAHFAYDLGEAWKNLTGLPFVFAAWISNKRMDDSFVEAFDKATGLGVNNIQDVLKTINSDFFDLREYYTKYISYRLDDSKRKGLNLFLQKLCSA
jgi:chorismate dehydratase